MGVAAELRRSISTRARADATFASSPAFPIAETAHQEE
jgi:hypothetical protein